jgi:hypothetical protein
MPKEKQSEPDQPESEIRREESKEAERLLGTAWKMWNRQGLLK